MVERAGRTGFVLEAIELLLVEHGIVAQNDMVYVNRVLNAAAWTYVAGTLQSVLTLLWYILPVGRD